MDDALEVFDVLMTEDLLTRAQKESTSRYLRGLTPLFWIPLLPYGGGEAQQEQPPGTERRCRQLVAGSSPTSDSPLGTWCHIS
jgi:hypothetical protein